jgi:biopolymer transport protein ExbB
MNRYVRVTSLSITLLLGSQGAAWAGGAPKKPTSLSLDDLLQRVRSGWRVENKESRRREAVFSAAKDRQRALLAQARARLEAERKEGERLEQEFDGNKARIGQLEQTLRSRLGTMGELFGVIRQVAGDTRAKVDGSLVSAQYPGRGDSLEKLARSRSLPTIKGLERLWYILQHEMTESGKVVRFSTKVVTAAGEESRRDVIRVGVFNAIADGTYLNWMPEVGKLVELKRQPRARYLATAGALSATRKGFARVAIDPSRGSVLSLLVQTPSFWERIQLGGLIGYIVIGIGIVTFLLALVRMLYLAFVSWRVRRQRGRAIARPDNPLGRILKVYEESPDAETGTIELKLDEAITRESTRLERFLWAIKIGAVVAPLLGLLGTVTGMIRTFQAITLFGTGDPKLMAGGISEALVTTMLGLCVAIPLVMLHSWLRAMSRRVVDVLEEQSAGIVARRAEQQQPATEPIEARVGQEVMQGA